MVPSHLASLRIALLTLLLIFLLSKSAVLRAQNHPITIHANGHVASLLMTPSEYADWIASDRFANGSYRRALVQDIYRFFEDDFDFIFLILNEDSRPSNLAGIFYNVSNDVKGIGLSQFDYTGNYGSAGQLKGVMQLTQRDYLEHGPALHELAHNWANFAIATEDVGGQSAGSHWGFTGGSTGGQLGGFRQGSLTDNLDGSYTVEYFSPIDNGGNSVPYNELELYLMGFIPISGVADFDVFTDVTSYTLGFDTDTFEATTRTTYTGDTIVGLLGQRSPQASAAQHDFRLLVIVLTDAPLTTAQWNEVDDDAEKFGRVSSDGNSNLYNFWEATGGLGTMMTGDLHGAALLPVELVSFEAEVQPRSNVKLSWITASETDNDHFTIERSTDANLWLDLQRLSGAGTSHTSLHYSAIDQSPLQGQSYYRLRQTDYDGSTSWSGIRAVYLSGTPHEAIFYPQPADDLLWVEHGGCRLMRTYDMLGKLVERIPCGVGSTWQVLKVRSYEPGTYFLQIDESSVQASKFIIAR